MTSVVVFDYGFGNVRSMVRALDHIGADVQLTADLDEASRADGVVIPGVGAFDACIRGLHAAGGDALVLSRIQHNQPVLGVCVGHQIMFDSSQEHGVSSEGLHLANGTVQLLKSPIVPHMGWNNVVAPSESKLFNHVEDEKFYFVHSYAVPLDANASKAESAVVSYCEYEDDKFIAAYEDGALCSTQFHPEKSGEAGLQLLKNWVQNFS
ncbi:MAG: imidazole glycerol phosphate synthase subunit HisH [Bifidobacteriaceae bacterium]|nr:imidazole glycerol phosphate synthase subunit HisH [Bifidobacteriaceae bacterium]